jgi:hypothetical protein
MTHPMRVLVYKSVATDFFDLGRIDDLCRQASIFNYSKGITGLLIFHEKIFFSG